MPSEFRDFRSRNAGELAREQKIGATKPARAAAASELSARERFRDACQCRPVDRPPIWLMRQAGRALPEYRKLKEKYSFLELVQTPELAMEVTLQPVRRFGFDAAILFSDILVVPEAMGQPYRFREGGGVVMDFPVRSASDIARLSVEQVTGRLAYMDKALRLLRKELGDRTALIGFSGSPWTLATFMMEGGSAERYTRAPSVFHEDPKTYFALAEKLTAAVTASLKMQMEAGADALQIFDSHGGLLPSADFQEASGRWIGQIITELSSSRKDLEPGQGGGSAPGGPRNLESRNRTPIIVFSLGTHNNWPDLVGTGASVLGIDWRYSLAKARKQLPLDVGIQGNLTPAILSAGAPKDVVSETSRLLLEMRGRSGYIFNLGHGVPPDAKLENIAALVETVRNFK